MEEKAKKNLMWKQSKEEKNQHECATIKTATKKQ